MTTADEILEKEYEQAEQLFLRLRREKEERESRRASLMQLARPPEIQRQFDEAANGKAEVIDTVATPVVTNPTELKLDLGSGPRPADGFKGVDRVKGITDFCFELDTGRRWPWADNSVSQFRSSHFIEHIRAGEVFVHEDGLPWCQECGGMPLNWEDLERQDAFFFFFDQAYRCAKPGATFELLWPALKNHRAFQDPTHRRFIPGEMMLYLDAKWRELQGLSHYNVKCDWVLEATSPTIPQTLALKNIEAIQQIISTQWNQEQDTTATLRARKP